jgi:hypothetical protein
MKKLLFVIAICGFVFTSCGNQTKPAATETTEATEEVVEVATDSTKCCAAKDSLATEEVVVEEVAAEEVK